MGTSGSAPDVTREDTRSVFSGLDEPHRPLTAAEVAEKLDSTEQVVRQNLEGLAETGELRAREIDDRSKVWWSPGDGDERPGQQSELEQFGAFVRSVEDYAIFMLDPGGTVTSWNEGAERIKGYSEDEIVGEHFSTFYTDEDVDDGVPERNLEIAAEQGHVEDEGWRMRADGTRFWANVVITAIRDADGALRGFTKVTRDMTERREYEQQLRRERDLTEQVLETVPVSLTVVGSDGRFVRANERALDRLGIDESDIGEYDVDSWELYDGDGETVPDDQRPWHRALETGETVFGFQCQVDLPDTGWRWLSINAAPITDGQRDEQVVVTVDDVTDQKKREEQLRRERNQTEKLLRTAPVGIAVQNADRETVIANQRMQEDLGLSEQDFFDDPVDGGQWEIYDPSGTPLSPDETPSARVIERQEPVSDEELVLEGPDGDQIHYRINAAPLFGTDGDIERVVLAGEDITELKEHERQLERRKTELETELSEIFDRVSDAFYALDEEWQFSHVNDRAAEIMGQSNSELLGQELWDVFPEARDTVYGETFRRAMETQEPDTFEVYGEDLDAWLEFNVYPSESGLSVYFRDVTERKERERDLERTERRFQAIFEDPNILVGLLDPDGTVLDINETAMEYVDADLDDVTGEPFWETPWWGDDDGIQADVKEWTERAAAGEYVDFEAGLTRPDGQRYVLDGVFRPVTNEDGDVVSVIVSDRDVTERREYERELEESERRYRALVENFPNGAVALVDENLRYQTVGGRTTDVAGATVEEVEGKLVREIIPEGLAEELVPRYEAAFDGESSEFEHDVGDRTYQFQVVPVRDSTGDVFAALGMSQDVTGRKERERELTKYETIVETVNDGIYVKDDEGYFTMVNDAYAELTGYDREELVGAHASLVVDEEAMGQSRDIEHGDADVDPGEPTMEATLQTADGGEVPAEGTFASFQTDDGKRKRVGVVRDVTERKEQRRRIEESERRYRTLVENFPNGAVGLFDENLEYTAVGGQLLDATGVGKEERVGSSVRDVYPEELVETVDPYFRAALDGESNSFEVEFHDRHLHANTLPVRNDDGDVFAGMLVVQDVTERREAQRELERALDLLEKTERIADVGGWEIDPETQDVFWSEHIFELLEVESDEEPPIDDALGMYHEEDRPVVEDAIEEALDTGDPFDVEVRLRTAASGEVRWLRLQGAPEMVDGDVVSLRGAAQDVTERKRRERRLEELIDRLEESNERLEQFAYAASHDLQEPLRMVSSYLRLIEQRYRDEFDEDGREFLEYAVDGADRMRDMIEGLLQYSRVDTRGDPFEPVDLETVLANVQNDLQMRIEEADAEITADELPVVEGDGGQLRQVFQNLLDNAIEYSGDEPPRIHVSARRSGNRWEVSVRDEGIGVDPGDADRIFEVFQSLHSRDEHAGTGIGLALCERIVERHGGDIWVESEPGEGATFTFTLPVADE